MANHGNGREIQGRIRKEIIKAKINTEVKFTIQWENVQK